MKLGRVFLALGLFIATLAMVSATDRILNLTLSDYFALVIEQYRTTLAEPAKRLLIDSWLSWLLDGWKLPMIWFDIVTFWLLGVSGALRVSDFPRKIRRVGGAKRIREGRVWEGLTMVLAGEVKYACKAIFLGPIYLLYKTPEYIRGILADQGPDEPWIPDPNSPLQIGPTRPVWEKIIFR